MYQSLAGHRVRLSQVGLFADGAAVREVRKKPSVCVSNMWMSHLVVRMTLVPRLKMYLGYAINSELAAAIAAAKAYAEREQIQAINLSCRCLRCQHEL